MCELRECNSCELDMTDQTISQAQSNTDMTCGCICNDGDCPTGKRDGFCNQSASDPAFWLKTSNTPDEGSCRDLFIVVPMCMSCVSSAKAIRHHTDCKSKRPNAADNILAVKLHKATDNVAAFRLSCPSTMFCAQLLSTMTCIRWLTLMARISGRRAVRLRPGVSG
jgi:hypothetical protein